MIIAPILLMCGLSAPPLRSFQAFQAFPASPACPPASTVATGFHNRPAAEGGQGAIATAADAEEWEATGSADLYGNEVSDAVARYRLDETGSLYEVHSPQTELPRLASPIS